MDSRAMAAFKRALEDARLEGYEQARVTAERLVYEGEDALFYWLRQKAQNA